MRIIFNDLFFSVYQYLGFGIIFAVITMLALPNLEREGIAISLKKLWNKLKSDNRQIWKFIFFVYFFMVLSRTLICRNIWKSPWEKCNWGMGIIYFVRRI